MEQIKIYRINSEAKKRQKRQKMRKYGNWCQTSNKAEFKFNVQLNFNWRLELTVV